MPRHMTTHVAVVQTAKAEPSHETAEQSRGKLKWLVFIFVLFFFHHPTPDSSLARFHCPPLCGVRLGRPVAPSRGKRMPLTLTRPSPKAGNTSGSKAHATHAESKAGSRNSRPSSCQC